MSKSVFIDTSYILALLNPDDQHHDAAVSAATLLAMSPQKRWTTEAIIIEIGNSLSRGKRRALGIQAIRFLREDKKIEVVPVDTSLLDRAIALYSTRDDKDWGLTDCISFVVMHDKKVKRALTTDEHFKQAGFEIAL